MEDCAFTIEGRIAGMNDIIGVARYNRFASASQKKKEMESVTKAIDLYGACEKRYDIPVRVYIKWYEPNDRRDPDNVSAGAKFILDAIVNAGILPNDNRKWIRGIYHDVYTDKDNPRIEVLIQEVKE